MALIQAIEDGKLVDTSASGTTISSSKSSADSSNGLGKEAFLQLLVAQMKYQDPLNPTDNTQYISQLATFSQLEATQNMQDTMTQSQANDLVGKQVIMKVTSSITGETSYASGQVDYVIHENGETYLSIDDKLYSISDLDTVADGDYMEAVSLAKTFASAVAALPSKQQLTLSDESKLKNIRDVYNAMTSYQQQYISKEDMDKLVALEEQMEILKKIAGVTDSEEDTGTV